ncbi:MAG: glycosyltransferase family 2 protein [Blastocatellia bacterium]|nr:glycosyltransferase family 2 protein [Blastocatellia bacterium]
MKNDNLKNYTRGWILGRFEPSLAKTDFEVGLRWNEKGDTEGRHYHKEVTEYVTFAGGVHSLNNTIYQDGDVLTIHPYMSTDYMCLEPGYCLTVKDKSIPTDKFPGSILNVVVPMAGRGRRFQEAGYKVPKALLNVGNKPMINQVVDNITPKEVHRFLLISRADVRPRIKNGQVICLNHETNGAVNTMLEVENLIGREDPLLIANCDQLLLGFDVQDFIDKSADCSVVVTKHDNPHHSYAKVGKDHLVTEVAEKKVISDKAIAGVYFYKKAKYFFEGARQMIDKDLRVNGEFYNSPVFNEIIANDLTVNTYEIKPETWQAIGTPEEYKAFLKKLRKGTIEL